MVNSSYAPNGVSGNGAYAPIPVQSIRILIDDIDWANAVDFGTPLTGVISVNTGTGQITGSGGTLFTTELNNGDYITFNDGTNPASQLITQVINITNNALLDSDANGLSPEIGGPYTYTNVSYYSFNPLQITGLAVGLDASADTSATGNPNAIAGNRLYYAQFNAYNWNTGVFENVAQTYATSVGGNLYDLGWEDYASWETAIDTLLTYAGWNATITTSIPDTSTIDNSNQEIVVYYVQDTYTFQGNTSNVIDSITFYEQSDVVQDYQSQLGLNPFQVSQINFNIRDGYGYWLSTGSVVNPIGVSSPSAVNPTIQDALPADFGEDVEVGFWGTSYNSNQTLNREDRDFSVGQFQVYIQYTIYDGFEAIRAEKLTEQGIQVSPENVDWFRKNIEKLGDVVEIDWAFDEDNPPEKTDPETYEPESEGDPRSYEPRNIRSVKENAD